MKKEQLKSNYSVKSFLKKSSQYRDINVLKSNMGVYTRTPGELYLMELYYHLLVETDYLTEILYDFLVVGNTYEEIERKHGIAHSYIRNVVYKGIKRLFEDVVEDPYGLIMCREDRTNEEQRIRVEASINRLEVIIKSHDLIRTDNLGEYLVLDLETKADNYREYAGKIDEDLLYATMDRLKYLSKPYLETLFGVMDKRILGYLVYLMSTKEVRLSDRDKEMKRVLAETWFIPYND